MPRVSLALLALLLAACASAAPTRGPADAPPAFVPAQAPLPGLVHDVAQLAAPSEAARFDALTALLDSLGLPYEVQTFESERRREDTTGRNVVVTLDGALPEIIVGAHYDAVRLPDGSLSAGSLDNGAGTVVLARVAAALRELPVRQRVRVVFFDMEELGLVGSRRFVAALDTAAVAAMVNVDVAGYGDGLSFGPSSHEGNERVYAAMWRVCAELMRPCLAFPRYPPSDDRSFQAAGVPNISVATMERVEAHQLWLMLNAGRQSGLRQGLVPRVLRTIHTDEDTPAVLEPDAMTLMFNAVTMLVLRLDRALTSGGTATPAGAS